MRCAEEEGGEQRQHFELIGSEPSSSPVNEISATNPVANDSTNSVESASPSVRIGLKMRRNDVDEQRSINSLDDVDRKVATSESCE